MAFDTSNHNGSTWYKVNLPITFKTSNYSVANSGWWGSCISVLRNQLSQISYMIWDYKGNTGNTQVVIITIGY